MRYKFIQFINDLFSHEEPMIAFNNHSFLSDMDVIIEYEDLLLYVSDIEKNYSLTVVIWHGQRWLHELKLVKKLLYSFDPDQRPYTLRMIGKPSSGPSPPRSGCSFSALTAWGMS